MREIATDDPVFGRLVWDGFEHSGWGGSFADSHYTGWGSVIQSLLPVKEEEEGEEDPETPSQDFLSALLSVGGDKLAKELEENEQAREMVSAARDFAARRDAYDGSLDTEPLRKAGRLKVVVPNERDRKPTPQQQEAWRAFCAGGAALAEKVAEALLKAYQQQRPERLRWWRSIYEDSPDKLLPIVKDTKAMRAIVRPKEFGVPARQNGETCVAIVFESLWSDEDIVVRVRDGKVTGVGRLTRTSSSAWSGLVCERSEEMKSPVFGPLRRDRALDGWTGVFHSDHLRGFYEVSQMRYRYRNEPELRAMVCRSVPPWDVVTGDFELQVAAPEGARPTPEQEAAFRAFNADPAATAQQVLSAIFDWYRKIRPRWIKDMDGEREEINSVMPNLKSPEGLLEMIQLQSVHVSQAAAGEEATGPREMTITVGPKAGKKIKLPPRPAKNPGVAIVLSFHWEDEHGLAVRWRNGKVETVGSWDAVVDE